MILSINPKTVSHRSHLFSSLIIIVTKSLSLSLKGENKRRKRVCCDVCVFYLLLKAYKQKGVVVCIICVVRRPKNSFFGVFFQTTHKKTKGKKHEYCLGYFGSYVFKDSLFIALLEWEKRGKKGTFEDGKKIQKLFVLVVVVLLTFLAA